MEATRTATLLNHLPEYTYLNTLPAITYLLFASHFQIPGKLWTLETFGLFGISVCSAPAKDTEAQSESQHTLHYTFKKDHSPHLKKFTTVVIEFAFNKHLLFKHHLCVRQFRNRRSDRDRRYRMSASDPFQELVDTLKRILTRSAQPLPASTPTPVTSAISSSSPVMFASPMARPTDSTPAPAIVTPPNHQPEARDQPEAMLTDMFRLTPAERRRRLTRGLSVLWRRGSSYPDMHPSPTKAMGEWYPAVYIYICVCVCVCMYVYTYVYVCMCICV